MSCSYFLWSILGVLTIIFSSCNRKKHEENYIDWNPQAKSYLSEAAKKEASNIEKGWVHVEGIGYHYVKPEGWTEFKNIKKGVYFSLTSPDGQLNIELTSRYIESIPEGVQNLTDWVRLQYSLMGMKEALERTSLIEVKAGDALEAMILMHGTYLRMRYFVNIFQEPKNQRSWLLIVSSKDKSRLDSLEVNRFLDTFRVDNFNWLNLDIHSPHPSIDPPEAK